MVIPYQLLDIVTCAVIYTKYLLLLLNDVCTSVGDSVDTDLSIEGTIAENGSEKGVELR